MSLLKGEGQVFPKASQSFDPARIPKAIKDAGFTATEVRVTAAGTLSARGQQLELSIPGVGTPITLSGGPQAEALKKRSDLVGKRVRITGKLQLGGDKPPTAMGVEEFQPAP